MTAESDPLSATKALNNLASVAINTSLISDTAATDDLGTEALYWRKLYLGSDISFEGATDDAYQTTLTAADTTTSDKTITLPNLTGTVALSTNDLSIFAATTSAQLYGVLSDETGSASGTPLAVFNQAPVLVSPKVDHIEENTATHGVVIDGVQLKDGGALAIVGGTNTFDITNGTASLNIAASSTLDVNANLTVETASAVNQDLTSDASPTFNQGNFTTVHSTTTLSDHIGEHTGAHGVVFDNDLSRVGKLSIDHVAEATGSHTITFDNNLTLSTKNIVTDTTTGTQIATGTTQKLGFFGATPVVQQLAATDLGTTLSNLGLRAAGTAYPLATTAVVKFDHIAEQTGAHSIVFDNTVTLSGVLGAVDVGGATSLEIPNGTSGTTDATGEVYLDTNGDGGTNFNGSVIQVYTGAANKYLFLADLPLAASQDNYILKYDATGKTVQWEADANAGGSTAWDDIGNPDADKTLTMAGYETTFTSTLNEAAHSVMTITDTTADLTAAVALLKLKYTDDGDADGTFLECLDNSGGDSKFKVAADGVVTVGNNTNISGQRFHWHIPIVSPNAVVTASTIIPICAATDAALTITKIQVTTSSASYEVAGDLKYADARIGLASATVVNDFDTTSGVRTDTSITSAAIASGKFVYLLFDSVPSASMTDCVIDVEGDYD